MPQVEPAGRKLSFEPLLDLLQAGAAVELPQHVVLLVAELEVPQRNRILHAPVVPPGKGCTPRSWRIANSRGRVAAVVLATDMLRREDRRPDKACRDGELLIRS